MLRWLAIVGLAGCGRIAFDPRVDGGTGTGDAKPDAPPALVCGPWSTTATRLVNLSSVEEDWSPAISPDGNTLVFASNRMAPGNSQELYTSTFSGGAFQTPTVIGALSPGVVTVDGPVWNSAGTELYFTSTQTGVQRLWSSTYSGGTFGPPALVPGLESVYANAPAVRGDGLEMYYDDFSSAVGGSPKMWRATRSSVTSAWVVDAQLPQFDTQKAGWPALSPDGLTLYVEGNNGSTHLFETHRATIDDAFPAATLMPDFDANVFGPGDPDFSFDSRTLFYSGLQGAATNYDIFTVTRTCN